MMFTREKILLPVAAIIGAATWIIVAQISGTTEAWDSSLYFTVGIPFLFAASFMFGFLSPHHPWIWGPALTILQPVALFFLQPETGPLILVGMFTFLVLAGLLCFAGVAGAQLKNRISRTHSDASVSHHDAGAPKH